MTDPKFDLTVAYRIYPKVSKIPLIFQNDKLKLAEVGVHTFRQSLGSLNAKVYFLLDNCPVEYETMILKYFDAKNIEFIRYNGIGNLPTFEKQIILLLEQNYSETVFFAEDDYIYKPKMLQSAVELLKSDDIDFVTPYDHLDSYTLNIHTNHTYEIMVRKNLHWRTSASTCLTFLTKKKALERTKKVFLSYCYGNWDSSLWFALTKFNVFNLRTIVNCLFNDRFLLKTIILSWLKCPGQILFGKRYKLWQPMPSIATHMEKVGLAPNVDWMKVVQESNTGK